MTPARRVIVDGLLQTCVTIVMENTAVLGVIYRRVIGRSVTFVVQPPKTSSRNEGREVN